MQLQLFRASLKAEMSRTTHGGDLAKGHRKLERPVSTRRPIHLTLHSEKARGAWSMLRHARVVREVLGASARRSGVHVYDFANVGSHLHLLVRVRRRAEFQTFLRSLTGILARAITGARRGKPLGGRFWTALAWSRVVNWGRDVDAVRRYIFRNRVEASEGPAVRHALEYLIAIDAAEARRARRRKARNQSRKPDAARATDKPG